MKESVRAARDEIAQDRCVEALKELVGKEDERIAELEAIRARRMPSAVSGMLEREVIADVLEELASHSDSPKQSNQRSRKSKA